MKNQIFLEIVSEETEDRWKDPRWRRFACSFAFGDPFSRPFGDPFSRFDVGNKRGSPSKLLSEFDSFFFLIFFGYYYY